MNLSEPDFHVSNTIEEFFNNNPIIKEGYELVVCWSGGKDSTALLLLLAAWAKQRNFPLTVLMVPYPKRIINENGREATLQYWKNQGIFMRVLDHNYPDPINVSKNEICPRCKEIRRKVLFEYYFQSCDLTKTIIATGHNSWDLAAYLIELNISRLMSSSKSFEFGTYDRYLEIMNKFLPVYSPKDGPIIIRPLLTLNDGDVLQVIARNQVHFPFSFIPDPCPWLRQRKRLFHEYFQEMGIKFDLKSLWPYANKTYGTPSPEEYTKLPFYTYLL